MKSLLATAPSHTEIVTGSPKDFDEPNEPVGLKLKRTTEENGVSCYWFFKGWERCRFKPQVES